MKFSLINLCVFAIAASTSKANELSKQEQDGDHLEAMESLLATALKSNLRATTQQQFDEINRAIAEPQISPEEHANETALSQGIGKHIGFMDGLKTGVENLMSELDTYDLSDIPDIKQSAIAGKVYTKEAIRAVEQAIGFLSSMNLTTGPEKDKAIDAPDEDLDMEEKLTRRLERLFQEREREGGSQYRTGEPTMDQEEEKWHKKHSRHEQKKFKKQHNDHPFRGHEQYKQHASTHYARKMEDLKEAMLNGDVHAAFSAFMPNNHHQTFHSHHNPARARRMQENESGKLARKEQCELLRECAMEMSMYDLFVYYYSDDIDPGTGEVDKNLVTFNERDIVAMKKRIDEAAAAVKDSEFSEESCDGLLSLFHRTIEWGDIPEWQGASINQVCLAEGTTVFVQFEEMKNALVDHTSLDGYGQVTKVSQEKWEDDVETTVDMLSKKIVVEPFQCAEELFYKGDRTDEEEFPFGGCGGKNPNCKLESYKIPTGMDISTHESRTVVYEGIDNRAKCDVGYEVKSEKECIVAAQLLGGVLKKGKITRDNTDAPCGCFIKKSTREIRWSNGAKKCETSRWAVTVCREHRNHNEYEAIQFQPKCEKGYEVPLEECADAGQAVGGYLAEKVILSNKGSYPCGCTMGLNKKIYYNNGSKGCGNKPAKAQSVCKRKKTPFKTMRRRFKCDPGSEIASQSECKKAIEQLGGHLVDKKLRVGSWKHAPCGCFISQKSGQGMFNTITEKCKNEDWNYNIVCKESVPLGEKYKKVHLVTECEAGAAIQTAEQCAIAGQAVHGELPKGQVDTTNGKDTPCGCFLHPDGQSNWIKFNSKVTGCKNPESKFISVCYKGDARDGLRAPSGQLLSNKNSAFTTETFDHLMRQADSCIAKEIADREEKCLKEGGNKKKVHDAKYYQCLLEKKDEALTNCGRFKPFQKGLELVFGKSASSGFICGVKDAVVKHDAPLPGSCCLDAPYELDGDAWGHPYDCDSPCKNPGPYLAGLDKKSCDAHGGSWCPQKSSNCVELKNCVDDMKKDANATNMAFFDYLSLMPEIEDPSDAKQCGAARQYFGFDEFFINDWQICEDVEQLKHSKDFDFLNEFFKQGGGEKKKPGSNVNPSGITLKPPDREKSSEPKVKFFDQWKSKHQTLANAADKIKLIADEIAAFECPSCMVFGYDPCLAICPPVKNVAHKIFNYVWKALDTIVKVSEFLMKVLVPSEPGAIESQEETKVVYDKMQTTAEYLTEMKSEITSEIVESRRYLYELPGGTKSVSNDMDKFKEEMKQEMMAMVKEEMMEREQKLLLAMKEEMMARDQKMMENMKEMMELFLTKITEQGHQLMGN